MKKTIGAIIKSTSAFDIRMPLARGDFNLNWMQKPKDKRCGELECFVPLEIVEIDDFGKKRIIHENFPDFLLNHKNAKSEKFYPHLSLVKVIEEEEVEQKAVIEEKTDAKKKGDK